MKKNHINDFNKIKPYFLRFAHDYTSQNGEDGIIEKIFDLLEINSGYCVDIGAWDGRHLSNTYTLLNHKSWSGMLFEANYERYEELKSLYNHRNDITCVCSLVGFDGPDSLSTFLKSNKVQIDFDFLTIDIYRADYFLWESLKNNFYPKVVCIEFNPTIPNNIYFIQEKDIRIQQGSSLLAFSKLGQEMGYILVATTIYNAFFIHEKYFYDKINTKIPNFLNTNNIYDLHSTSMCTQIFQTYDGEIKIYGLKKLLWHKIPMNIQKFQLISKKNRKFPFAPNNDTKLYETEKNIFHFFNIANKHW